MAVINKSDEFIKSTSTLEYISYEAKYNLGIQGITNSALVLNTTMASAMAPSPEPEDGFYFYENIENLKKPWITEPHFVPLVIIYGSVFLWGIIGNAIVIFSVIGGRGSRSVTFSFMVSLAIADVLFLLVVVPHETLRMVLGEWSGGRIFCKISGFTEMLTASASILNLTAVSFERYFVIVMPMQSRRKCTIGNTRKILVMVWIFAVFLSAPVLYVKDTESTTFYNNDSTVSMMFCDDQGLQDNQKIHFAIYQFLVMFVIPTILMVYCYTVVIYVLWISGRTFLDLTSSNRCRDLNIHSNGYNGNTTQIQYRPRKFVSSMNAISVKPAKYVRNSIMKGRKQVIKMLITVIIVFLLCWGPKLIFTICKYSELRSKMHFESYFNLQIALYCLPYIQSCLNPVIYGFMSKNFRKSVVTSCNNHVYRLPCKSRRSSPVAEFELESKYSNGTIQTKAVRNSASTSGEY